MENIDKTLRINELLEIYQELLTPTQKDILIDYFRYDLSISEIADNRNVSRAAVEDALNKGINKLEDYEKKLGIFEKKAQILDKIQEIKEKNSTLDELERMIK